MPGAIEANAPQKAKTTVRTAVKLLCERRLHVFVCEAWPIVMQGSEFKDNWHIKGICLPYNSVVETRNGPIEIGRLVETEWTGDVRSYSHATGCMEWRPVVAKMKSPGKPLVTIRTASGKSITATSNHPVFIVGRGYVSAEDVRVGDRAVVRILPQDIPPKSSEGRTILQHGLLWKVKDHRSEEDVQGLRLRDGQVSQGSRKVLSVLHEAPQRQSEKNPLQKMREAGCEVEVRGKGSKEAHAWRFLQSSVLLQILQRKEQFGIHRRSPEDAVHVGVSSPNKEGDSSERRKLLFSVREKREVGHSSYRPPEAKQQSLESGFSLSPMPFCAERHDQEDGSLIESTVSSVEQEVRIPETVYNIEVAENNNYFANGVLVHNCEHLEAVTNGYIQKLLINIPPGCSKTALTCIFWPAWVWLTRPQKSFLCASYMAGLSKDSSRKCRALIRSEWYQNLWGERVSIASDQDEKMLFENTAGGWRMATSTGGEATGRHPHYRIIDDPHKVREADSGVRREDVLRWYGETWSTRGIGIKSADVIIMQRLHASDLSGHVLKSGGWEHICLPMWFEKGRMKPTVLGWTDPRTEEGELLHPKYIDEQTARNKAAEMGPVGEAGQFQQRPTPRGGLLFNREWFSEPVSSAAVPATAQRVRYWDKAGSVEQSASATAGVLMARDHRGIFYVYKPIRGHWLPFDRNDIMKNVAKQDAKRFGNTVRIYTEREGASGGKESAMETIRQLAEYPVEDDWVGGATGNKEQRAHGFSTQCKAGNVKFVLEDYEDPSGATPEWLDKLYDRMEQFPRGENDEIDAMAGAYNKLAMLSSAIFSPDKLRYYRVRGNIVVAIDSNREFIATQAIDASKCRRFGTVSVGGLADDWSCLQLWDYWSDRDLLFLRLHYRTKENHEYLMQLAKAALADTGATVAILGDNEDARRFSAELQVSTAHRRAVQTEVVEVDELTINSLKSRVEKYGLLLPYDEQLADARREVESSMLSFSGIEPDAVVQSLALAARFIERSGVSWGALGVTPKASYYAPSYTGMRGGGSSGGLWK